MTVHVVEQGECVASVAAHYRITDWRKLWDAQSDELRKKRPDPNLLFPGDKLDIPVQMPVRFTCATGLTHTFRVALPVAKLRIRLRDGSARPLASKRCLFTAANAEQSRPIAIREEAPRHDC